MVLPGQKPRGVYKRRCIVALHSSVCYSWDLFLFSSSFLVPLARTQDRQRDTTEAQIGLYHLTLLYSHSLSLSLSVWWLDSFELLSILLCNAHSSLNVWCLLPEKKKKRMEIRSISLLDGFLFFSLSTPLFFCPNFNVHSCIYICFPLFSLSL